MEAVKKYLLLMNQFIEGSINPDIFEKEYLDLFKSEVQFLPEKCFDILNELFLMTEAYCKDSNLRDEFDIDEHELLSAVTKAKTELELWLNSSI